MTPQEKQDLLISQFEKTSQREDRRTEPTQLEKLVERSRARQEAYAPKKAKYENQERFSPKFIHTGK